MAGGKKGSGKIDKRKTYHGRVKRPGRVLRDEKQLCKAKIEKKANKQKQRYGESNRSKKGNLMEA